VKDNLETTEPAEPAGAASRDSIPWPPPPDPALGPEYAECLRIAHHYENFPVASRLLPRACRPHLAAVYAFARAADDIADEPTPSLAGMAVAPNRVARLEALDRWEAGLDGEPPRGAEGLFRALAATRRDCRLPDRLLRNLLTAFRWDVERDGFATWEELRNYADYSAAPIGRLVVAVAGADEERIGEDCDDLCVALQYTNFWQDLSVDWPRGRLYLPEGCWSDDGVDRELLEKLSTERPLNPLHLPADTAKALVAGLREAVEHTEALYRKTEKLPRDSGKALAPYLGAVWEGGHRVLDLVRQSDAGVFVTRPSLGWRDRALTIWRAYRRRRAGN
jgi:squalene synthase HpnC